jgi:predicted metal-binding membrane protein
MKQDFGEEISSAAQELFGGSLGTWLTKLLFGAIAALIHAVEAAWISITVFAFLCIADAILGVLRQIKRNRKGDGERIAIKAWRVVSGPASKWFVAAVVLVGGGAIDLALFGTDPAIGGPILKFLSGIILGAIIVEVAAKADYLQGWGLESRLRERFPELFG